MLWLVSESLPLFSLIFVIVLRLFILDMKFSAYMSSTQRGFP